MQENKVIYEHGFVLKNSRVYSQRECNPEIDKWCRK